MSFNLHESYIHQTKEKKKKKPNTNKDTKSKCTKKEWQNY